jgi:hypothetical protein
VNIGAASLGLAQFPLSVVSWETISIDATVSFRIRVRNANETASILAYLRRAFSIVIRRQKIAQVDVSPFQQTRVTTRYLVRLCAVASGWQRLPGIGGRMAGEGFVQAIWRGAILGRTA